MEPKPQLEAQSEIKETQQDSYEEIIAEKFGSEKVELFRNMKLMVADKIKAAKAVNFNEQAALMSKIARFGQRIREKFPNFSEYALWHVIGKSTLNQNKPLTNFDFPEEDSVEAFVEQL